MLAKEIGRHIYQNLNVPICFSKRHSPAIPIITKNKARAEALAYLLTPYYIYRL